MSTLAHQVVVDEALSVQPAGTLYVLHGFLGSGGNWTTFARRLVDLRPDWRAVLVDLRLHGDSRGLPLPGPNSITSCAEDLIRLHDRISQPDRPTTLLGHSFGGKVALVATSSFRSPPIQTWLIDSTPEPSFGGGSIAKILELVARSPDQFASRDEAVAWIRAGGFDEATARWMAMSLKQIGNTWVWQLDVDGLLEMSADFGRADLWPIVESPPDGASIHFIQAEHDSILSTNAYARLERLEGSGESVHADRMAGGHWLHIDNPAGLVGLLAGQLPRL